MPCSLDMMLSNHGQSIFEYLAPARRGGSPSPCSSRLDSSTTGLYGQGVLGGGFHEYIFIEHAFKLIYSMQDQVNKIIIKVLIIKD